MTDHTPASEPTGRSTRWEALSAALDARDAARAAELDTARREAERAAAAAATPPVASASDVGIGAGTRSGSGGGLDAAIAALQSGLARLPEGTPRRPF
ncbi:hypothetical protein [Branchiibius cervicis]|uniref:Uncharacterized protein n=1 Tax=Branchiibius cervicis TaxID=908252 RepID=A0ABW2AN94_9MICO